MKLKKGQEIPELKSGLYGFRLERHISILPPLVKAEDIERRMREKNYYDDNGAIEDIEITGPFEHLNLICKI